MNEDNYNRIIKTAQRAIRINRLLKDGNSAQEVVEKTGANRQLVDYYIKQLEINK